MEAKRDSNGSIQWMLPALGISAVLKSCHEQHRFVLRGKVESLGVPLLPRKYVPADAGHSRVTYYELACYYAGMTLYRFSPISSEAELMQAIEYMHAECNKLVFQTFGKYLPVRGCIGVFTHYDDEFASLTELRKRLASPQPTYKNKYFRLYQPITVSEKDGIPAATYEYLYIRKVDPYRSQVGDIDFVLPVEEHEKMKQTLNTETFTNNARLFGRPEENMIELWNPDVDVLPYVAAEYMRDTIARENLAQ